MMQRLKISKGILANEKLADFHSALISSLVMAQYSI